MTGTSTYCLEDVATGKIAISPEDLRSLFVQIEAELHRSEIYRRAVTGAQKSSEAADRFQHLIKAVGREAIRLALRQLVRQPHDSQAPTPAAIVPPATAIEQAWAEPIDNPFDESLVADCEQWTVEPVSPEDTAPAPVAAKSTASATSKPKSAPASPLAQQREAAMRQIGQQLRRVRQARSVSFEQLHNQTRIPMHQLKALEAGEIDCLPEDVFTRSFIRQVGNALGLNGIELAASLPAPDLMQAVVPSWMRSDRSPDFLRPVHLYVGYVTLMAGAVGGLAWLTHQPLPDGALSVPIDSSDSLSQSDARSDLTAIPNALSQSGSIAQPDLTPPEHLPF